MGARWLMGAGRRGASMSVPDCQLEPCPDYVECEEHGWVYPVGSVCQACLDDVNDEYADQAYQDRVEAWS